jgi:hypothetical protein
VFPIFFSFFLAQMFLHVETFSHLTAE